MQRRWFNAISKSNTDIDVLETLVPQREGYVCRLRGYHVQCVVESITYSTTATWQVDAVLTTERRDLGQWSIVSGNTIQEVPQGSTIDGWRFDGGVGRVVTSGGYLITRTDSTPPVSTDLEIPALYILGRRLTGLSQFYVLMGWVDFEWVRASSAKVAAVHQAWSSQGTPRTT